MLSTNVNKEGKDSFFYFFETEATDSVNQAVLICQKSMDIHVNIERDDDGFLMVQIVGSDSDSVLGSEHWNDVRFKTRKELDQLLYGDDENDEL